ncbi:MAG: flagellar hook-associated protein FlgK, partial [Candidatus Eisenbacteria bacterium]|nr:flagellar hook-associated protein FlgK [Candidatus Eisenbacteria bacterium]
MSLSTLLSVARSALLTHQKAMGVIAQNVANATTPGYSRQRLNLAAATPVWDGNGYIGRGVDEQGITRARDRFLDGTYRRESGLLGHSSTLWSMLSQVEGAVSEPSDVGVAAALDAVFQSFSDLANDPANPTNREIVRTSAQRFVQQIHQLNDQIVQAQQDAVGRMRMEVERVNTLATQIASLNQQILQAGDAGAPDLADQRDLLIDEASTMIGIRVLERPDGTIGVAAGGLLLVDGPSVQRLAVRDVPGGGYGIGPESGSGLIDPVSGSLNALSELTTTNLPEYQRKLDEFTEAVVTEFNALHSTGYNLNGETGINFFDPTGTNARSIALSAEVEASGDAIAAGGTPAPGDNTVALQIAALATTGVASLGGKTLRDAYVD